MAEDNDGRVEHDRFGQPLQQQQQQRNDFNAYSAAAAPAVPAPAAIDQRAAFEMQQLQAAGFRPAPPAPPALGADGAMPAEPQSTDDARFDHFIKGEPSMLVCFLTFCSISRLLTRA